MKNENNSIEVFNVKKHFKVYYDRGTTIKDRFLNRGRNKYERREVLKGISFEVKKGEAIGIIGRNGSGKSTTLKLLSKIIYPSEGSIEMKGRVSSLLELGAGFHPDMSGRENIYMNAAVFGLNRKEIDKSIEGIIRFSELEDFIDNPIRTYSSGMYMRLAFTVAINVNADVLLIDEILAVGDVSFQKKCFEKLSEIKRGGTTIVIVSHSMEQIEKICDRSLWLEDGVAKEIGLPYEINRHYMNDMEQKRLRRFQEEYYDRIEQATDGGFQANEEKGEEDFAISKEMQILQTNLIRRKNKVNTHEALKEVWFTQMYVTDKDGKEKLCFETGEKVIVYLKYNTNKRNARGTLCLLIYRDDDVYCYGTNTFIEKQVVINLDRSQYLKVVLYNVPLLHGKYFFTIAIHDEQAINYDIIERVAEIQFYSNKGEQGIARINSEWYME